MSRSRATIGLKLNQMKMELLDHSTSAILQVHGVQVQWPRIETYGLSFATNCFIWCLQVVRMRLSVTSVCSHAVPVLPYARVLLTKELCAVNVQTVMASVTTSGELKNSTPVLRV